MNEGGGWRIARRLDHVEGDAAPELVAHDGPVACWRKGGARYCAAWPQGDLIDTVVARAAADAGLPVTQLAEGERRVTTTRYCFTFDFLRASVAIRSQG